MLEGQIDGIEPLEQHLACFTLERKRVPQLRSRRHFAVPQIHRHAVLLRRLGHVCGKRCDVNGAERHGHDAVTDTVTLENRRKTRRKHRAYAVLMQGPHGMLTT